MVQVLKCWAISWRGMYHKLALAFHVELAVAVGVHTNLGMATEVALAFLVAVAAAEDNVVEEIIRTATKEVVVVEMSLLCTKIPHRTITLITLMLTPTTKLVEVPVVLAAVVE